MGNSDLSISGVNLFCYAEKSSKHFPSELFRGYFLREDSQDDSLYSIIEPCLLFIGPSKVPPSDKDSWVGMQSPMDTLR